MTAALYKPLNRTIGCIVTAMVFFLESAESATSVSQRGITWTFSEDRPVGQFANGDYWVQLPVTITSITPVTANGAGGSMINPTPGQTNGLSSAEMYDPAKNIALHLPYLIETACSLVSTIAATDWAYKTYFKEIAVLTLLESPPQEGSFRPPYAGSDKKIAVNWNVSSMNFSALRKVKAPILAHVPDRKWLEDATVRPLLEYSKNWPNSNWKATDDESIYPRRAYGREISNISAASGLYLNLDFDDKTKQQLLINMCQWGIDVYGLINAGMEWQANGGHNHGRKLPLFITAKVLGDPLMLQKCDAKVYSVFQEDMGHWFVTQKDIDTPRVPDTLPPYTQDMLGMPEWGGGAWERERCSPSWNGTGYRFINGGPNCGAVLCVSLMNGRADYGNEAYFKYIIERYYPKESPNAYGTMPSYGDSIQLIVTDLWNDYIQENVQKLASPDGLQIIEVID